jgi:hypothetical protein
MSELSSSDPQRSTSVNLVRSSHPWTKAESAAGFVLRYLAPMRRHLTAVLGSVSEADEALNLLLTHLVNAGFGDHRRGRLRDFIVLGLRSAAKARVKAMTEEQRAKARVDELTQESKEWMRCWRDGLLERAWRSLERQEHAHPESPVFSVLHSATVNPQATPEMLVVQMATDSGVQTDASTVRSTLPEAKAVFAQLIADEVAETLSDPSPEEVKQEIQLLGLSRAFEGISLEADRSTR